MYTSSGLRPLYLNWNNGQPSGGTGENCGAIRTTFQKWHDFPCSNYNVSYVCKKPAKHFVWGNEYLQKLVLSKALFFLILFFFFSFLVIETEWWKLLRQMPDELEYENLTKISILSKKKMHKHMYINTGIYLFPQLEKHVYAL